VHQNDRLALAGLKVMNVDAFGAEGTGNRLSGAGKFARASQDEPEQGKGQNSSQEPSGAVAINDISTIRGT
jgi:hypothetical protein